MWIIFLNSRPAETGQGLRLIHYIRDLREHRGESLFNHREHGLTRKYAEENLRDLHGEIVVQTKLYNSGSEGI